MKLLSQVSRKYKGKEYRKYWAIIPPKTVEDLGWDDGDELTHKIEDGKLVIEKQD